MRDVLHRHLGEICERVVLSHDKAGRALGHSFNHNVGIFFSVAPVSNDEVKAPRAK